MFGVYYIMAVVGPARCSRLRLGARPQDVRVGNAAVHAVGDKPAGGMLCMVASPRLRRMFSVAMVCLRVCLLAHFSWQVFECMRRLLLTGLLVFVPDTSGQVAYGCIFAFIRCGFINQLVRGFVTQNQHPSGIARIDHVMLILS